MRPLFVYGKKVSHAKAYARIELAYPLGYLFKIYRRGLLFNAYSAERYTPRRYSRYLTLLTYIIYLK
jgi:hypothetical protein